MSEVTINGEKYASIEDYLEGKVKLPEIKAGEKATTASKYETAVIPAGFTVSGAGTEKTIDGGLVIYLIDKKDDGTFEEYRVINPEIISNSEELIYVEEGEGCLSVTHDIPGIVPRYARVNVSFYDENGKEVNVRVREEIAVAFQHEIDHLNGILYIDKIDRKNPYKDADKMRAI